VSATEQANASATDATVRLNWALFDQRAEAVGARTETAKAALMGVTRETLWRYRQGTFVPGSDVLMRTSASLGVTIDSLVGRS
jgi:transcriptional regulator with XRE-family HTH domain